MFNTLEELFAGAAAHRLDLAEFILRQQVLTTSLTYQQLKDQMEQNLIVMEEAIAKGLDPNVSSLTGLVQSQAQDILQKAKNNELLCGELMGKVIAYANGVSVLNAAMGRIVAAPTAGSCGILPAVLVAAAEKLEVDRSKTLDALIVAAAIGLVVSKRATLAGAAGGCQAECGVASAMAAGALVYMRDGSYQQIDSAISISLKNMLGLACDPVGGLVEIPCIKRNSTSAAHAVIAADMAFCGLESIIPADEVIDAMADVGRRMPIELKETARGGLAITPTGKRISARFSPKQNN